MESRKLKQLRLLVWLLALLPNDSKTETETQRTMKHGVQLTAPASVMVSSACRAELLLLNLQKTTPFCLRSTRAVRATVT